MFESGLSGFPTEYNMTEISHQNYNVWAGSQARGSIIFWLQPSPCTIIVDNTLWHCGSFQYRCSAGDWANRLVVSYAWLLLPYWAVNIPKVYMILLYMYRIATHCMDFLVVHNYCDNMLPRRAIEFLEGPPPTHTHTQWLVKTLQV